MRTDLNTAVRAELPPVSGPTSRPETEAPPAEATASLPKDQLRLASIRQTGMSGLLLGPTLGLTGAGARIASPVVSKSLSGLSMASIGLGTISGSLSGRMIQDKPLALAVGCVGGFALGGTLGSHRGIPGLLTGGLAGAAAGLTSSAVIHALRPASKP